MALRIRIDGRIFCAALSEAQPNDLYLDDEIHYGLSVINKVLVTTPNDFHMANGGEWWWKNQVPEGVIIDEFYYT